MESYSERGPGAGETPVGDAGSGNEAGKTEGKVRRRNNRYHFGKMSVGERQVWPIEDYMKVYYAAHDYQRRHPDVRLKVERQMLFDGNDAATAQDSTVVERKG